MAGERSQSVVTADLFSTLLAAAGLLHIGLLRDLRGVGSWALALTTGLVGFESNLSIALVIGLALWWLPVGAVRVAALAGVGRPAE